VDAWIGHAPMRNETGDDWPLWYAEHRVRPYLRTAAERGDLGDHEVALIASACDALPDAAGPSVAPARLHGDLWSGNVCWSGDPVCGWLIDPAAHGGHPETDLGMLALFGCPHLDAVLSGYQEVSALAPGWRDRVGMHQLFPLLVHVVLFGAWYAGQAVAAARSVLRIAQRLP
jgi:fructosamine-3-kinase